MPPVLVSDLDGTTYSFTPNNWAAGSDDDNGQVYSGLPDWIESRNGNRVSISQSSSGAFSITDTAGRPELVSSGFGSSGNTVTVSGLLQPYTLTWGTVASSWTPAYSVYNGGNGGNCIANAPQAASNPEITAIELPNSTSYQIQYDPVSGLPSKVIYPNGAYVRYVWGTNPASELVMFTNTAGTQNGCELVYAVQAIKNRYVSFDGTHEVEEQDFSYQTSWITDPGNSNFKDWSSKQTIVKTTDLVQETVSSVIYNYVPYSGTGQSSGIYVALGGGEIPLESSVIYQDGTGAIIETKSETYLDPHLPPDVQLSLDGQISKTTHVYLANGVGSTPESCSAASCTYGANLAVLGDEFDYDYGAGSPGPLLKHTHYDYAQFPASPIFPDVSLFDRPKDVITYDGSGNKLAETDYTYDQFAASGVSGLPAGTHDETNYGANSSTSRGNITTIERLSRAKVCFGSCTLATTTYSYDETGQPVTMTNPNGNVTRYSFADNPSGGNQAGNSNAYLTQITYPAANGVQHVQKFQYDYGIGYLTEADDENGQPTDYTYNDSLRRLTEVQGPPDPSNGGQRPTTMYAYNDAGSSPSITTSELLNTSGAWKTSVSTMDGMGHVVQTQLTSDPEGTDYVDTTYDGLGLVYTASNPYRSTSDPTYGVTTDVYDPLNRMIRQNNPDNTSKSWIYGGHFVIYRDENGNEWQRTYDALGRLTNIIEPSGGSSAVYTYDALDNLTGVTHGNETRTFHYDGLSRLTSATNPEWGTSASPGVPAVPGTTNYFYIAADGTLCSGDPSDVCSRTDPRGISTTYAYDALNRLTAKTYSDGTPAAHFNYDESSVTVGSNQNSGPWTINNGIGRLTSEYTGAAEPGLSMKTFSYDAMGRPVQSQQCWGTECSMPYGTRPNERHYDLAGEMIYLDNSDDTHFTYTYDGAGNLTTMDVTNSINGQPTMYPLIYYPVYDAAGQPLRRNGNDWVWSYDNRLRVKSYFADDFQNFPIPQYAYTLTYYPNSTIQSAVEQKQNNSWTWQYTYDGVNRLKTATSAELSEGCIETYDQYGNRTSQAPYGGSNYTCLSNAESFTGDNNRIDGASYDASGDLLEDPPSMAVRHSYTYDAEGRLAGVDGTTSYVYGADGMRVGTQTGSSTTNYIYDFDGSLIARYLNGSNGGQTQEIWVDGKRWGALSQESPTTGIVLAFSSLNWVGTDEVQSDPSGDLWASYSYLPFGDGLTASLGDPNAAHFTGKLRDQESGNDYFGARYYSSTMGRFMSPDWSAKASPVPYAKLNNPQSLNLYSFVGNNPLSRVDPDGHYTCSGSKDQCAQVQDGLNLIRAAETKLGSNSKGGIALQKTLDFYGAANHDNGVHVGFASLGTGVLGLESRNSAGVTSLTFDTKQINAIHADSAGIFAMSERAGVIEHEGTHGADDMARGRPVTSRDDEWNKEHNGYYTESFVFQGLGVNSASGLWNTSWGADQAEHNREKAVQAGATDSTDYWCSEPGNGACK